MASCFFFLFKFNKLCSNLTIIRHVIFNKVWRSLRVHNIPIWTSKCTSLWTILYDVPQVTLLKGTRIRFHVLSPKYVKEKKCLITSECNCIATMGHIFTVCILPEIHRGLPIDIMDSFPWNSINFPKPASIWIPAIHEETKRIPMFHMWANEHLSLGSYCFNFLLKSVTRHFPHNSHTTASTNQGEKFMLIPLTNIMNLMKFEFSVPLVLSFNFFAHATSYSCNFHLKVLLVKS